MDSVRRTIATEVRKLVGSGEGTPLTRPPGDDGLFGPASAAWKVHGDFTTMMIGGTCGLLLQMLHPGALAGVWDHSNFRHDMLGRLRRTAQFMGGTTYGSTEHATALIARVQRIHDRVHGQMADGTPYSANDPAILTWVHVTGADSFLRSYVRYRDPWFAPADQDRFLRETARVARLLGAADVPETRRAVAAYFRRVRPRLRYDARTRDVARALMAQSTPHRAAAPAGTLIQQAAIDLMPDWAARMHGLSVPLARRPLVRAGAGGLGQVLRWALKVPAAT